MILKKTKVEGGWVEGIAGWDQTVAVYRGIPYGKPPVGELRWKEPQPAEPWEGVYKAYEWPKLCIQDPRGFAGEHPAGMSEDCLYINVWTPAKSPDEKLPVLFHIHGGGYIGGGGNYFSYDGEAMAKKGIVMVTFNYRVGIFGYFCHPQLKEESPHNATGNYALLDQIFALKWVKRNISAFGGDPDNITGVGLSAGSGSLRAILNSPLSKGLLARAATMSVGGHSITPENFESNALPAEANYCDIKEYFGCDTIEEVRKIDGMDLYNKFWEAGKGKGHFGGVTQTNVIDGYSITENMYDHEEKGLDHNIPRIIGTSADEMGFSFPVNYEKLLEETKTVYSDEKAAQYVELLKGDRSAEFAEAGYRPSGERVRACAIGYAQLQDDLDDRTPTYLYLFSRKAPGDPKGASHGLDLFYIYKTLSRSWQKFEGADYELSDICNEYWANFCKTGNPNGPDLPLWLPYTKENPYTMILDINPTMKKVKETKAVQFILDEARANRQK